MLETTESRQADIQLADAVQEWLNAIRREADALPHRAVAANLVQLSHGAGSHSLLQAVALSLEEACEQVAESAPDSAELLTLYYWQRNSIQAIKNNRQRRESVPTLWRRLKEAVAQLADVVAERERVATAKLRKALMAKLPKMSYDVLFGRKAEISDLTAQLTTNDHWVLNLVGLGGLGKSTLAHTTVKHLIAADQLRDLCWVQLDHHSPQSANAAQAQFDTIVATLHARLVDKNAAATSRHDRLRQLRQRLQTYPTLLVIDHVDALVDDGLLSEQLYELANPSRFLLISRTRIVARQPVRLIVLRSIQKRAALHFVRDMAGKLGVDELASGAESIVERALDVIGGHPQALRLFVRLAHYFSAETILDEFESAETRDITTLYQTIYDRLWQQQSDHARRFLDAMRLLPAHGADIVYLTAICGLAKSEQWDAIRELSDVALLERIQHNDVSHYYIHNLTDSYLNSISPSRSETEQAWFSKQQLAACRYWQAQLATGNIFERYQPHLVRLVRLGIRNPTSWQAVVELMLSLYFPIVNSLFWQDWMPLFQNALDNAQPDTHALQYRLYSRFATLHHIQNDFETASKMHHHALALADSLGDLKGVGREHVNLCIAYRHLGCYEKGAFHGETALDIFEELQLSPHFQVAALNSLGQNAFAATQLEDADQLFKRAIATSTDSVPAGTVSRVYSNWGDTLRLMGKHHHAYETYQAARQLETGVAGQLSALMLDVSICNLYLDEGRLEEAQAILEKPLFNNRPGSLPIWHRANVVDVLGRFHLLSNQLELAIDTLKRAKQLWYELLLTRRVGLTAARLARAYYLSGKPAQADHMAQAADRIFDADTLDGWRKLYKVDMLLDWRDSKRPTQIGRPLAD